MKKIVDAVKIIQNQPPVRYNPPSFDEDYDDNFYTGDDYSDEDEGTSAPIKSVPLFNTPMVKTEDHPHSKLLNGYTNENQEINVNTFKKTPNIYNSYSFCFVKISDQTIDNRHV